MLLRRLLLFSPVLLVLSLSGVATLRTLAARPASTMLGRLPAEAPSGCSAAWAVVTSPSPGGLANELHAVTVRTPTDAWAVGRYITSMGAWRTLILHWDGATWTLSPSPSPGGQINSLEAVTALSSTDVWAFGYYAVAGVNRTLALHWDGSAWSQVATPNSSADDNALFGVAAVSATNLWAVGDYQNNGAYQTLALHWDGAVWTAVATPNVPSGQNSLGSVAAVSANDVWAVGGAMVGSNPFQNVIEHWTGSAWQIVASPNPGAGGNHPNHVTARNAGDLWAVGFSITSGGLDQTMTLHWDGTAWTVVTSPNPGTSENQLWGVIPTGTTTAWAVGWTASGGGDQPLTLYWDGSQWSVVAAPSTGRLWAVATAGASDLWAVGNTGSSQTLIEHYTSICGSPTPTPSPTGPPVASATPTRPTATGTATATPPSSPTRTPATATASTTSPAVASATPTPTAATFTATVTPPPTGTPAAATATPTVCPLTFSDVPPANPFYPFIRCLACRSIVAGYADGTFRWGANVTRGQLSKIIANAAGLTAPIPTTQQTFSDVPSGNAFWLFIERLAATGAISGYACGGPGEPCDPQQRPYFRWGLDATRSQISKIDAQAAQFTNPIPTTQQTFADVPPANAFWVFIERLAGRGIISGYACGGPGEPCDPQSRPYFRWGAPATRGQLSKIAANTFFPGCQTPVRH